MNPYSESPLAWIALILGAITYILSILFYFFGSERVERKAAIGAVAGGVLILAAGCYLVLPTALRVLR